MLIKLVCFPQEYYLSSFNRAISKCTTMKQNAKQVLNNFYQKTLTQKNHPIKALSISYLLFNLLLPQWAILREPSANDPAADQPLRPIRLPEQRPLPGGCWGARLPLHARFLRQQMWQDGHRSLPGSRWVCGAAWHEASPHCSYFITGMFDLWGLITKL